jgi:NADH:ubiquinone oxidoreductase subunit C
MITITLKKISNIIPVTKIYANGRFSVCCFVEHKNILMALNVLKLHQNFRFKVLSTISCTDFPELKNRFELTYTLLSVDFPIIINVKTKISEFNTIESSSMYYRSSVWLEREIWDMFGVYFINHFDLRRILTDYGYPFHPLRKTFPLQGFSYIYFNAQYKKLFYKELKLIQRKPMKNINSVWSKVN